VLDSLECRREIDPDRAESAALLPPDYFTAASLGRAMAQTTSQVAIL
jgi:hypothetical protein